MRTDNFARQSISEVVNQIPEGITALQQRRMSASTRFSLRNQAAATSTSVDEVMAVLDYRVRRSAQRTVSTPVHTDAELELV